jgi:hypothetical protein
VKKDEKPFEIEVHGHWVDDPSTGRYWRDFKGIIEGIRGQRFDCGDGTELMMVDFEDIASTRVGGQWKGLQAALGHGEAWSFVLKMLSYEPFARTKYPVLSSPVNLTSGVGSHTTSLTVPYSGTAEGEPTYQFIFTVPSGVILQSIQLSNDTQGQIIIVPLSVSNGTYTLLIDASGGVGGSPPILTPNNNYYGLLAFNSLGYGCTLNGVQDKDFSGSIPTLQPSTTIPPTSIINNFTATVTATGALTTATFQYLSPTRFRR